MTLGPLLAGLCFAFISLVPGLIISGILGALLVVGCALNAKSIKCDELIKKINAELENRVEQLAMDDILKETYKPELVKKGKSKSVQKENDYDLGL